MTPPRSPEADETDYDPPPYTASQAEALRIATTTGPYFLLAKRAVEALESLAKDFGHYTRSR